MYFSFYPNPIKEVLHINLNTGLEFKLVNIYNSLGQYLYSAKTKIVDINTLKSGIYFIEIITNQGKSTKKIIKE
ncbi:T9SS type A sorting domain-containing protein [uncultured Algibacter sp.]|uniref:T9SS type A sorting domain-containing protein n=1 Tax=uncultured Algibacter sp. TaxID=298659 RepID=UPI0034370023